MSGHDVSHFSREDRKSVNAQGSAWYQRPHLGPHQSQQHPGPGGQRVARKKVWAGRFLGHEELKRQADAIFTAINISLRYSVRYGGIPFELRVEKLNAETLVAIDDVNNRNMSKTFPSLDDLMEDLNA